MGLRAALRVLRSRRLAIWLLGAAVAWSVLAMLFAIDDAFSAPIFVVVMAFLAISTALCAIERSSRALKLVRRSGTVTKREIAALESHPQIEAEIAGGLTRTQAMEAAATALRGSGLAVTEGEHLIEGESGRWGVLGSPVFHWALALLIIVIGLGQMTRSEGLMGIPVGESVIDAPESYRVLDQGLLFRGSADRIISVEEMELDYMDGDVDRGAAPTVAIADLEGNELARGIVYPNHPLRHGATMIHISDYGLAPELVAYDDLGVEVGRTSLLADFREDDRTRSTTAVAELAGGAGEVATLLEVVVLLDADQPTLRVIDYPEGKPSAPRLLKVGESIDVAGGRIEFVGGGYYARLSVVNDWSVPVIYALLALGLIGLCVAVIDPHRRVLVKVSSTESGPPALVASAHHGQRSVLFEDEIRSALMAAVGQASDSDD